MEYSNFKDNINSVMFNQMSKNILNWIKKNRTNEEIVYDNPKELLELLNSSKSLKAFHPDLYKKLGIVTTQTTT